MFESYDSFRTAISELNWFSIILRLTLSMFLGGVIGIDRARKRRPAGLRTYMLVCIGATLVMITNQYITLMYPGSDPARLGAQVVSGIGFLGAGTIIVTRHHQVIGLTTAAGLWASACMGLAIGIGFYEGAIAACGFLIIVVMAMHRFDNVVTAKSRVMEIYVELKESGKLSDLLCYLSNHNIKITYIDLVKGRDLTGKGLAAIITMRLPSRSDHLDVLQHLNKIDEIGYVEEV